MLHQNTSREQAWADWCHMKSQPPCSHLLHLSAARSAASLSMLSFIYLFLSAPSSLPLLLCLPLVVLPFSCAAVLLWETITEQLLPLPNWFLFPLSILLPLLCHSPAVRSPLHSFQFGELQHFPYILSFFFFFFKFFRGKFHTWMPLLAPPFSHQKTFVPPEPGARTRTQTCTCLLPRQALSDLELQNFCSFSFVFALSVIAVSCWSGLAIALAWVKWRHVRRGGMMEQPLQWGVLLNTHTSMLVHIQWHKLTAVQRPRQAPSHATVDAILWWQNDHEDTNKCVLGLSLWWWWQCD